MIKRVLRRIQDGERRGPWAQVPLWRVVMLMKGVFWFGTGFGLYMGDSSRLVTALWVSGIAGITWYIGARGFKQIQRGSQDGNTDHGVEKVTE